MLNLVRDTDFDKLPSYSLSKWEECKKLEISYFELKEFEKTLGQQMVEGQAQLTSEFVNEYGDSMDQLRANTISDTQIVNVLV